jgi:hypothetical protein
VREQTYLVLRELAVGVLQRCGHSNLNSLQLKTITLNDIPTCSSSIKKIDKKLTTQKQKTIDSSQQKENSPLKEKSNEGSVSMSLSKDAANSISTQGSISTNLNFFVLSSNSIFPFEEETMILRLFLFFTSLTIRY